MVVSHRLGFITTMSPIEGEADKAEHRMKAAISNLRQLPLELVTADSVVSSQADALKVAARLRENNIDALAIMAANWTNDAVLLSVINTLRVPVLLWAIPYPATYSIPIVQHVASVLREIGVKYRYVYGEPSDRHVAELVFEFAKIASAAKNLKAARIGLVGPRPTWRVAGPADTTYDEIDISRKLGCEIVHVDTGMLMSEIQRVSDEEARRTIHKMKDAGLLGNVEVEDTVLLGAVKSYVAIKNVIVNLGLDGVAIECYPEHLGLTCLAASWLADEGTVVGCEGDVGSTIVAMIMQRLASTPAVIIEPFWVDESNNRLLIGHPCGSGAISLAESNEKVHLRPSKPEGGVFVQFPIKPGQVTLANISGRPGTYRMFIATARSIELTPDEWSRIGGIAASIKFEEDAKAVMDRVIQEGIDHHWVTVLGDLRNELTLLCELLDIRPVLV